MFRALNFNQNFSFSNVKINFSSHLKFVQIILCNPKKRNLLSSETIKEINDKFNEVEKYSINHQARIMVLKAEGSVFSAGHDLKELQTCKNPKQIFESFANLMLRLRSISIPTICAVNGIVTAAGFQLIMGCDMIVATHSSKFGCSGINWGVFCSTPGVQLVRSINSQKKANEMLLFGQQITSDQAYQYGIINKVLRDEQELQKCIQNYISKANNLSSEVMKLGKQTLIKQRTQSIEDAYKTASCTMHVNVTEKSDCQQGLAAFTQKRKPNFKN